MFATAYLVPLPFYFEVLDLFIPTTDAACVSRSLLPSPAQLNS